MTYGGGYNNDRDRVSYIIIGVILGFSVKKNFRKRGGNNQWKRKTHYY